jgi:hypothetical protein
MSNVPKSTIKTSANIRSVSTAFLATFVLLVATTVSSCDVDHDFRSRDPVTPHHRRHYRHRHLPRPAHDRPRSDDQRHHHGNDSECRLVTPTAKEAP